MSCETNTTSAGRAGQKAGITSISSKSAFIAGVTSNISGLPSRLKSKIKRRKRKTKEQKKTGISSAKKTGKLKEQKKTGVSSTKKTGKAKEQKKSTKASGGSEQRSNGKANNSKVTAGQASVFAGSAENAPLKPLSPGPGQVSGEKTGQVKGATVRQQKPEPQKVSPTRSQQQIKVAGAFSGQELQKLSVQFRLDAAAARKQVQALKSGTARGIGHDDPRPADWAQSDLKNYDFIVSQIGTEPKRSLGRIDVSSLSDNELVDLWDFSRHEADQAVRFIDHLQVGGSHIKGETASYLTGKYKLKGQFCAHMAEQLEPMITPKMIDDYERS